MPRITRCREGSPRDRPLPSWSASPVWPGECALNPPTQDSPPRRPKATEHLRRAIEIAERLQREMESDLTRIRFRLRELGCAEDGLRA